MRTEEATWLPWLCLKQKALAQVQTWALWRGLGAGGLQSSLPRAHRTLLPARGIKR